MVMTQDTLDKTRSEFSYVFSRSAHHFSLPLLIRIHQARDNLSLFLFFLVPSSFIPNFSIKKRKKEIIVVSLFFFQTRLLFLKKYHESLFSSCRKNVTQSIVIEDQESLTRLITRVKSRDLVSRSYEWWSTMLLTNVVTSFQSKVRP